MCVKVTKILNVSTQKGPLAVSVCLAMLSVMDLVNVSHLCICWLMGMLCLLCAGIINEPPPPPPPVTTPTTGVENSVNYTSPTMTPDSVCDINKLDIEIVPFPYLNTFLITRSFFYALSNHTVHS